MAKIVVGPIDKGLKTDVLPFNIDNTNFPKLINAYQWRGRVRRKRGTSSLGRLTRYFNSSLSSYGSIATIPLAAVTGAANLLSGFGLESTGNIVPGTVTITVGGNTYTDPNEDGTLTPSGSINYASGDIAIPSEAGNNAAAIFKYYPVLPGLGFEDFLTKSVQFPGTLAFDDTYAYNVVTAFPYPNYSVSFYKNPNAIAAYPGYVRKTNTTPTSWNGADYQQFWSTNYQGAFWVTNGINVPFAITNIGMQYKPITGMSITSAIAPVPPAVTGGPSIVTLTITAHGLFVGDFLFINEVLYTAPNLANSINFQTGYVFSVIDANNVSVEFPNAYLTGTYASGGIAQYLTNRSDVTKDCLRWYDGDPTNGNITTPALTGTKGWVNFAPPLSRENFSIAQTPAAQYYLVGARMILPFKDRILFFGPVIQTSAAGSQIYLQDTVIFSQNGTPFYTASFTGDPSLATTTFTPILVPDNQTATPNAYWEDQTGFGGFQSAAVDQPLLTVTPNKDVILCGFNTLQSKLVYTENDLDPFKFYLINSELGSGSTFSSIDMSGVSIAIPSSNLVMSNSVMTRGSRGYILTNQENALRSDLDIPDQVYQIRLTNNGPERFTAHRDYVNEWNYLTYTSNQRIYKFPNQTLQYNYRDSSWAIFNESYTHYGNFRKRTGFTWQTVGLVYPSWSAWNAPWNSGASTLLQPEVVGMNSQGFMMVRDDGTDEAYSLSIKSFSGNTITSQDHTLNNGDYITINGCLGIVGEEVNGKIFSVSNPTATTFQLNPPIQGTGTYLGGGLIKRMYVPFIQTKQFNPNWANSRKTRIGVQQYLLTKTERAQIQLLMYLSQNATSPYNTGPIVPNPASVNNSILYSTVLYTCPESTNLGLTPFNSNLQTPTAINQDQIWHRKNTSLIGDTVQLGFTMSDSQMRELDENGPVFDITAISAPGYPTTLTASTNFRVGQLVRIEGVVGMVELNDQAWQVTAVSPTSGTTTTVTINADSTTFGTYISGGTFTREVFVNQFAEIELHGFTIEVAASQLLS